MGYDYALVHVKYTIPPALVLSFLYRPLCTKLDLYKTLTLITIAVVATIPWDDYLIRRRIWSYPPDAIIGPLLLRIPIEELFFFVIQTYNTSLLYLCISKSTFHPQYLPAERPVSDSKDAPRDTQGLIGILGSVVLAQLIPFSYQAVNKGGNITYLALITIWAAPFLLLTWSLSFRFILRVPRKDVILPIMLPTVYLWVVDTFAMRRGTWVIENGTKLGINLWPGLEIEEALFFFLTNTLIVLGLIAFDHALAILDSLPRQFPHVPALPSPRLLIKALQVTFDENDAERIQSFSQAIKTLEKKSRSFYLASSTFRGRLQIDLILLYSFCRIADDLVDASPNEKEAKAWVQRLRKFLDTAYASPGDNGKDSKLRNYVQTTFPEPLHMQLLQLPTTVLSSEPLYSLLQGFEMDILFSKSKANSDLSKWPIKDDSDLEKYGYYVAGTVAELCLDLVFHHVPNRFPPDKSSDFKQVGAKMGIALQTVNIARDIKVDAEIGRVYIPVSWLKEEGMTPQNVLDDPASKRVVALRKKLLAYAFRFYREARPSIEKLPYEVRGPMRVAIESYMEIGRVLQGPGYEVKKGKATVPWPRRIWIAWRELSK